MFEDLTGKKVENIITLIAVSNGTSQLFVEKPSEVYYTKLLELRDSYKGMYGY